MPEKTPAQKKAQKTYMSSKATIQLVDTPERKDAIKAAADAAGESVSWYIKEAIRMRMETEKKREP